MPSPGDLITKVKDKLLAHQDLCLVLEPGRSLIGSAVTLVTKVIGCKENRDTKFVHDYYLIYYANFNLIGC